MKIGIYVDDNRGYIHYNPYTKQITVTNPIDKIRWAVYSYLTTEHSYRVPASNEMGDFREVVVLPTESASHVQFALCEMFSRIGVHVDWKDTENEYDPDLSRYLDKSEKVESINGKCTYEIINHKGVR